MIVSNIFFILPVIYAAIYHEWLYLFFATGVFIFSPLYHWYQIINPRSLRFYLFKTLDWMFAVGAFIYMYYYTNTHTEGTGKLILFSLLSLAIIFFLFGWRKHYAKLHPWFHIIAPTVSSLI